MFFLIVNFIRMKTDHLIHVLFAEQNIVFFIVDSVFQCELWVYYSKYIFTFNNYLNHYDSIFFGGYL